MTNQQQILINDVLSLPTEGQRQVADFVARLKVKQQPASPGTGDLSSDPFIGMWKDRLELEHSTAWVRNLRKSEW